PQSQGAVLVSVQQDAAFQAFQIRTCLYLKRPQSRELRHDQMLALPPFGPTDTDGPVAPRFSRIPGSNENVLRNRKPIYRLLDFKSLSFPAPQGKHFYWRRITPLADSRS